MGLSDSACRCIACLDQLPPDGYPIPHSRRYMVLCALCGNKRCPHAADHRYACTGSNEPNQVPRMSEPRGKTDISKVREQAEFYRRYREASTPEPVDNAWAILPDDDGMCDIDQDESPDTDRVLTLAEGASDFHRMMEPGPPEVDIDQELDDAAERLSPERLARIAAIVARLDALPPTWAEVAELLPELEIVPRLADAAAKVERERLVRKRQESDELARLMKLRMTI